MSDVLSSKKQRTSQICGLKTICVLHIISALCLIAYSVYNPYLAKPVLAFMDWGKFDPLVVLAALCTTFRMSMFWLPLTFLVKDTSITRKMLFAYFVVDTILDFLYLVVLIGL